MEPRQGSALVAVAFLLCEHLTFFPEEIELIWSHPWRSRLASWLFIITRYSPYAFNAFETQHVKPAFTTVNLQMSGYLTLMFRTITAQFMFLVVQFILSKRLTLFYPGVWVRVFILPGFMIARLSLVFTVGSLAYHAMVKQTDQIGPSEIMGLYSGVEATLELTMLGLMSFAYFTKMGARRNPVMYRLGRREGVGAPIFCIAAMIIAFCMQYYGPTTSQIIYPVYLSVISALGCRLILSNHKAIQAHIQDIPTPEYELVNSHL